MGKFILLTVTLVFIVCTQDTEAHSGMTNAAGCHTNPKTGKDHCHKTRQKIRATHDYCLVYDREKDCGYTSEDCEVLSRRLGGSCVRK